MHFAFLLAALAATINQPVVNMYSASTVDADVVSQAIYGSSVAILEQQGSWVRVRTEDGYTGWVEQARMKAESGKAYASAGRIANIASLFAHVYREASVTRHQPLLTLPFETALEVIGEPETNNRRWLQVRLVDDRSGWVQRGDVSFLKEKVGIAEAIALSRRFLGLPYTWGGTSSFGYDCSGFTQMLCRRQGILMPRDADQQAVWDGVTAVERSALVSGDLLFFGRSIKKITHTGFYIGDGQFIHATVNGTPVIQISALGDQPWTRLLVASRRPK